MGHRCDEFRWSQLCFLMAAKISENIWRGKGNFDISKLSCSRVLTKEEVRARMHRSLSQALSLGFQRTLASTEAKVSSLWTPLHCPLGPLTCSHPYVAIHTAGTCALKAAGDAGVATGPRARGMSASEACVDMGMSFSSLPPGVGASGGRRGSPGGREGGGKRE